MILIFSLVASSIQLPFIIKFGKDKSYIIIFVTYFLIFFLSSVLKSKVGWIYNLMQSVREMSFRMIMLGIIAILILLILALILLSIKILEKKEY